MNCKPFLIDVRQIILKTLKTRRPDPLKSDRVPNPINTNISASCTVQANELAGS